MYVRAFESKEVGDYNEELYGDSFKNWFSTTLPKLEDKCIIVLGIIFL